MLPEADSKKPRGGITAMPTPDHRGQRVLVVDDEEQIRHLLASALRFAGFVVDACGDGRAALDAVGDFDPDLVLLDVMMPTLDGLEVCRRMRAGGLDTPVIFLSARDATDDKVVGLTEGADDYVTKPFALDELVARIDAVLKRTSVRAARSTRHEFAGIVLDEESHRVWRDGVLVDLSPTEFRLLRFLLLNAERVVSKAQILSHVWGYDFAGDSGVVETYVFYLRRKVDATEPKLIRTVRGVGYTLRAE
jgi:two-component system OmpR family response regulator